MTSTTAAAAEEPPLVKRLFGERWEELDSHPDCWNRLFGPDSDVDEDEATERAEEEAIQKAKIGAKNLLDHNWIKQRLDEEVTRFVLEDLKWKENRALNWRRAKLLMISCVIGLAAQFPYLIPLDSSPMLRTLSWGFIVTFFMFFGYGQLLGITVPWNSIVETLSSSENAKDGFFVETDLPKYTVDYKVTIRSSVNRQVSESCVVPATILFTPGGRLTPDPLQDSVKNLLEKVHAKVK